MYNKNKCTELILKYIEDYFGVYYVYPISTRHTILGKKDNNFFVIVHIQLQNAIIKIDKCLDI